MAEKLYKKCACDWRPKCEALGPCGQYATVSEWMPDYANGGVLRPIWQCDDHSAIWRGRGKVPGIDRPNHADEYWRPSLMEAVRHAQISEAFEKRKYELPPPHETNFQDYESPRIRKYNPQQKAQLMWLREAMKRQSQ